MKALLAYLKSEDIILHDPLLQYAKVEFKKDVIFAYNWMKNNPGKDFNYETEAK